MFWLKLGLLYLCLCFFCVFMYFLLVVTSFVVSTRATGWLERLVSEIKITCYVLSLMLNSSRSLSLEMACKVVVCMCSCCAQNNLIIR